MKTARNDPLGFVISPNLKRRQLTASQLAFVALEVEKVEAARAKVRQSTSTGGATPQLVEKIPQADSGKARDKAAAAVGANPRYVSDADGRLLFYDPHHLPAGRGEVP